MMRTFTHAIALVFVASFSVSAEELAMPEGDVVLSISGGVEASNSETGVQLDLAMLAGMEKTTIETSTIWTEGVQTFEGVSLATMAEKLGLSGSVLRATAINDYTVEIPMTDAVEGGPIVAYLLNGEEMSVRDKGPLWIVYPYDSDAEYRTEVIYSRSIWQLDRIEVAE